VPFAPFLLITIPWDPNVATIGGLVLAWHGVFTAVGILAGVQISLRVGKSIRYNRTMPDRAGRGSQRGRAAST
jgi:hypothetical protein